MRKRYFGDHYKPAEAFYDFVKEIRNQTEVQDYALISLDFDSFNYINDLFSYELGDKVLYCLSEHFDANLKDGECFSCLHADHFAFMVKSNDEEDLVKRFTKIAETKRVLNTLLPEHYSLACSGGIVSLRGKKESLPSILDMANFARKQSKGSGCNSFLYYDKTMSDDLYWRKIITMTAEESLSRGEFVMYLQPKILLKSHKVVGAEALVRWNSPKFGLVYPDKFIPILEQNGFIKELDFFMLGETCKFLQSIAAKGLPQLNISVNFSKLHLRTSDFATKVREVVSYYGIDPKLIELEMTENVFSEDFQRLVDTSQELREIGFRVSLDDFGKAYSSLNYLKELPLDIIKIDKAFLNGETDSEKGRLIITKMVELIRSLKMVSCMEGVETEEQVEFLASLGCDLAQGFYYSKAVPHQAFLEFLKKDLSIEIFIKSKEESAVVQNSKMFADPFRLSNRELFTLGKNIDMGIIKGELTKTVTIEHINDKAIEYFGYTREELKELFHSNFDELIHPDDREKTVAQMQCLAKNGESVRFHTRIIKKDGSILTIEGQSSSVEDIDGKVIGLHSFRDITNELKKEADFETSIETKIQELEFSNDRYRTIAELSDDIVFEWDLQRDTLQFLDKNVKIFGGNGYYTGFSEDKSVHKRIHPADLETFERWIFETINVKDISNAEFRVQSKPSQYVWYKARTTTEWNKKGVAQRAIGVFIDINKQKNELDYLKRKSQTDPLTRLLNNEEIRKRIENYTQNVPNGSGAYVILDVDNFKDVNDNLGHQFGDTVLKELSSRVMSNIDETDIAGRLGGDEIVLFLQNVKSKEEVSDKIKSLLQSLRGTYFGATAKYDISVSAGVALYPADTKRYEELYQFADIALYESKRQGKDCYTFYDAAMVGYGMETKTPMDLSEQFLSDYFEGDLIYNVFEQLYETKDIDTTIQMILKMLGEKYKVDRVYIFENSMNNKSCNNTYEWCAEGIRPEKENLQNLSLEELRPFLNSFGKDGIVCRDNIADMDPYSYEMLGQQGIKSLLHCAILEGGKMTGFIGYDMCSDYRNWRGDEIAILGYLSRILSVFLLKRQAVMQLVDGKETYSMILDNIGDIVYAVDMNTHEVLYMNPTAKKLGIQLGDACYTTVNQLKKPCEDCPIEELRNGKSFAHKQYYSNRLKIWMSRRVSKLNLSSGEDVALISCEDFSKVVAQKSRVTEK